MSILITGGTGSLGAYLTKALLKEGLGDHLVLFDYRPDYERVAEFAGRVEIVSGNIADWPDVLRTIKEYKVRKIFHLAALLFTESMERPYAGFKINLEGTVNLLEAARMYSVEKVIFASTIATYGPGLPEPVKEGAPQVPESLYGIAKLAGELWGLYYHRQYGIDFRALRFARIVNAGRSGFGTALFPSSLIEDAVLGRRHEVNVPGDYRVPITYIKDAARALVMLYKASDVKRRIYNINGILPSAGEIVDSVKAHIPDAPVNFAKNTEAPPLPMPLSYDDTRASEEFGWGMKYDLDAMIDDFIQEVQKKHGIGRER
ncbi:MAG: NAD-dependent epimerase/dehydratase family protein [Deltaproteobacteria bacterium]|nr:NAD-dependent epimerase/dehydratase family protein [Deltaproteobacteria bacterium]